MYNYCSKPTKSEFMELISIEMSRVEKITLPSDEGTETVKLRFPNSTSRQSSYVQTLQAPGNQVSRPRQTDLADLVSLNVGLAPR